MNIGFVVERRYLRQAITEAIVRTLQQRGVRTDILCAEDCHFEPSTGLVRAESGAEFSLRDYDAVISRSRNVLGLAMLAYAEAAGIPSINSYRAVQRARNKAEVALALGPAGIPCAPTILADRASVLADLSSEWFPLILKAIFGDNSQGLRIIRQPEELYDLHWGDELALAQHYVSNDGYDLKLYVCGARVFAMRKPSPLNSERGATAVPIKPDRALREIALRCGEVLGLDIYGVDAIATPEGPLVIEVNEFPNFTHVPGAAEAIAGYLLAHIGVAPRTVVPPASITDAWHQRIGRLRLPGAGRTERADRVLAAGV